MKTYKALKIVLIVFLLYTFTVTIIQRFKCPNMTDTELMIASPKLWRLNWIECKTK